MSIVSEAPEMQGQLVSAHGMLAILEVLEGRGSREVIMRLLQIINLVSTHWKFDIYIYISPRLHLCCACADCLRVR
jgi:hypothetical protein